MNTFFHLVKREILEHKKGIFYQILIIAVILLVTVAIAAFFAKYAGSANQGTTAIRAATENAAKAVKFSEAFFWIIGNLFYLIMFITSLRYLTACLHKEREDKSILFWKSMPVSDTQSVLSKLFTGALVIPATAIGIFIIFHFAMLMVFTVLNIGKFPVAILWTDTNMLSLWFMLITSILSQALWAAPLYGVILIYSAYQKEYGHGLIISIIVASILEKIITYILLPESTAFIFNEFLKRFVGSILPWLLPFFKSENFDFKKYNPFGENVSIDYSFTLPLNNPDLWYGLLVTVLCIMLTILIRNRRT